MTVMKNKKKVAEAIRIKGSIGDELMLTPIVKKMSSIVGKPIYVQGEYADIIFKNNPYVTEIPTLERKIYIPFPKDGEHMIHLVDYFAKLLGIEVEERDLELFLDDEDLIQLPHRGKNRKRIAVDTRCGWPIRQWSLLRYNQLCNELMRVGIEVIEVGKHFKNCFGDFVTNDLAGPSYSFVNQLSLRQTASVISQCDVFLGSDSGLAHVASAVGTPAVVLFGPIHPSTRCHNNTIPVFTDVCQEYHRKHLNCFHDNNICMRSITVESVYSVLVRALFNKGTAIG